MKQKHIDRTQEILAYLQKHGTVDKDAALHQKKTNRHKRILHKRAPRLVLDLHGLRSDDAVRRVRNVFLRLKEQGVREILIIHGKGFHSDPQEGPVLKKVVRDMLQGELSPMVRDYRQAMPRDGGSGATLVVLR